MKEKLAFTFFSQMFSSLIYLFANFMLFTSFDIAFLGIWTFSISVVNLVFINIGVDTIHLQYSGKENSSEYFGTYFMIKSLLIIIDCFITLIIITTLQLWSSSFITIILILLFSRIISHFAQIFVIDLKTQKKIFKIEIPFFLTSLGKSITIFYLFFYLSNFSDPLIYLSVSIFFFDIFVIESKFFIPYLIKNGIWRNRSPSLFNCSRIK